MSYRIIAAAAAAGLLTATPAYAGENDASGVKVEYGDLDLTSVKGQATLERRVMAAVDQACEGSSPSTGSRIITPDKRRCLEAARQNAKSQIAAIIEDARRGG